MALSLGWHLVYTWQMLIHRQQDDIFQRDLHQLGLSSELLCSLNAAFIRFPMAQHPHSPRCTRRLPCIMVHGDKSQTLHLQSITPPPFSLMYIVIYGTRNTVTCQSFHLETDLSGSNIAALSVEHIPDFLRYVILNLSYLHISFIRQPSQSVECAGWLRNGQQWHMNAYVFKFEL